jgi:hypothetical protein
VRYADGLIQVSADDLWSDGFGVPWGQSRTWTNGAYAVGGSNGTGWLDVQAPYLIQVSSTTVVAVTAGGNARYFDWTGQAWQERFFLLDSLTHTGGEFVLTDPSGNQLHFYDFATSLPLAQRGRFKSLVDPYGNSTSVTSWTSAGLPGEVQRSTTSGGVTITESYCTPTRPASSAR